MFRTKRNGKQEVERNKARLVAKAYSQRKTLITMKYLLMLLVWRPKGLLTVLAAQSKWKIFQMDV